MTGPCQKDTGASLKQLPPVSVGQASSETMTVTSYNPLNKTGILVRKVQK